MTKKTGNYGVVLDTIASHFVEGAIKTYGQYVLEDRAVPIDLDGLKPSHRRIILSMRDLNIGPTANYRKAATVIGHAMGNYHPHGDSALYGAMVGMCWLRYPLIDWHGNWGSPLYLDNEAAAYRYTECRMSKLAKEIIDDLDVIPTIPNFDGTRQEALVIPARVPLLLCNGTSGIAVGVAGAIPPHNLKEVITATSLLIKHPKIKAKKVIRHLLGPDHREGGIITSPRSDIVRMYKTGKGTIRYECKYEFEQDKGGKCQVLVVKSIAPGFNPENFQKKCGKLKEDGIIEYCEDESDGKTGIRITIGFKTPQAVQKYVIPMLSTSMSYNFYAIRQNWENAVTGKESSTSKEFKHYTFVELLRSWIGQRREIEKRLLIAEKEKVEAEISRCEARLFATQHIDEIVKIFKDKRNDTQQIQEKLVKLGLTQSQAEYVCELKLIQIRKFSEEEQTRKIKELKAEVKRIEGDLKDLDGVLLRRLKEMKEKYGDERMTSVGGEGGQTELKMKSKSKYVIVSSDAGFKSTDEVPTKKSYFPNRKTSQPEDVFITKGADEITVVFKDGSAIQVPAYTQDGMLEYEKNEDAEGNVVCGIASERHKKLLMIDEDGIALAIDNPQKQDAYTASNCEFLLKFAAGVNPKDRFFIINENGNAYWNVGKSLVARRKGSKGKRFERLGAVTEFYVVREGQDLWDSAGNKLDPFRVEPGTVFKFKHGKSKIYVLSEKSNVLLTKSGNFVSVNRRQAIPLIRKGDVVKVWAME